MTRYEQAKEIGREACIDRLGRDFIMRYRDTSCPAFADMEDHAYCSVSVDNTETRYDIGRPVLTSKAAGSVWPYYAKCNVRYSDGNVEFLDCVVP